MLFPDVPKVAFAVSLGGNGLQKTTSGAVKLIYRDVLTDIGQTYNSETGEWRPAGTWANQKIHQMYCVVVPCINVWKVTFSSSLHTHTVVFIVYSQTPPAGRDTQSPQTWRSSDQIQ